jgi:pSer/pThr/pTyr-binding forkhead associated (FHA) protein
MSGTLLLALRLALAAGLYGFLLWALYTLWRSLQAHSERLAARQPPPITLTPAGDGAPERFTLPLVIIGRDPACECPIEDPTVSTQHARLSYHHNQWWIEDLHSRNGTYLNQEPVTAPIVLTNADQLRCGQVVFTITIGR